MVFRLHTCHGVPDVPDRVAVRGDLRGGSRASVFAGLGFVIGTVAKLGIVCAIVAIAAALFLF
jgi:hypothetical protein